MKRQTLNPEILNRCLKLIEEVYDESMYGENDIYRIKDLIHSVDKNHWLSKQWLVREFYKLYNHDNGSFYIGGGWYGLLSHIIRMQWRNEGLNITSGDIALNTGTAYSTTSLADTSLAEDAVIGVNIDGAGTGAKGLKVTLIGYQTNP